MGSHFSSGYSEEFKMSIIQKLSNRLGADNLLDHPQELFNTFEARPNLLRLDPLEDKFILQGSRGAGKTNLLLVYYYVSLAFFLVAAHRNSNGFRFPFYANMAFQAGSQQSYYRDWTQHLGKEIQQSYNNFCQKLSDPDWPELLVNLPLRWIRNNAPTWYNQYLHLFQDGENPGGDERELKASLGGAGIDYRLGKVREAIQSLEIDNLQRIRDLSNCFHNYKLVGFIDEVSGIRGDIDAKQQYSQIMDDSFRYQNVLLKYAVVKDHYTDKSIQGYQRRDLDFDISSREGYIEARSFIRRLLSSICGSDIELDDYLDINDQRDDALREIILFSLGHPRAAIEAFRLALDQADNDTVFTVLPEHIQEVIKRKGNEIETNLIGTDVDLRKKLEYVLLQCSKNSSRYFKIPSEVFPRFQRLFWNLDDEPLISRCNGKYVFVVQYSLCLNRGVKLNEKHTSETDIQQAPVIDLVLPSSF